MYFHSYNFQEARNGKRCRVLARLSADPKPKDPTNTRGERWYETRLVAGSGRNLWRLGESGMTVFWLSRFEVECLKASGWVLGTRFIRHILAWSWRMRHLTGMESRCCGHSGWLVRIQWRIPRIAIIRSIWDFEVKTEIGIKRVSNYQPYARSLARL